MRRLTEAGVGTGIHYPVPIHLQEAYAEPGSRSGQGAFPVTERCAKEFLSLPMFPALSDQDVEAVIAAVRDFFPESTGGA